VRRQLGGRLELTREVVGVEADDRGQLRQARSTRKRLGDTLVGPIWPVGVGLQENLSTPNLLTGPLELLDHGLKLIPLLIR
jgi:hypothetical protein